MANQNRGGRSRVDPLGPATEWTVKRLRFELRDRDLTADLKAKLEDQLVKGVMQETASKWIDLVEAHPLTPEGAQRRADEEAQKVAEPGLYRHPVTGQQC